MRGCTGVAYSSFRERFSDESRDRHGSRLKHFSFFREIVFADFDQRFVKFENCKIRKKNDLSFVGSYRPDKRRQEVGKICFDQE